MINNMNRRDLLKGALASAVLSSLGGCANASRYALADDPFTLGVASGSPLPDGVVLWTRLAPHPLIAGDMPPVPYLVHWEVAADAGFRQLVQQGTATASAALAHSVHVQVQGLAPDRWYWYRFRAGDAVSPVARTRTAPADSAAAAPMRFAFASCQDYAAGFYDAWGDLARQEMDLVVFLGDYIYESAFRPGLPRAHPVEEAATLAQYRHRYALYKMDSQLQAAHAAAPWIITMDDHEVGNDLANDSLQDDPDPVRVLQRRAAAYQAWYEHMPVRNTFANAQAGSPHMRVYTQQRWGQLASFYVTDVRQYRDHQACPPAGRYGGNIVRGDACPERLGANRSMLGTQQERWLMDGMDKSATRWNILAQQTLLSKLDIEPGSGENLRTDGWDGYPAARQRLLDFLGQRKPANPVVIGGDVHSHWASDVKADYNNPASAVVASEFCTTSISSQTPRWMQQSQKVADLLVRKNPHIKGAWVEQRGYSLVDVSPQRMTVQMKVVEDATRRGTAVTNAASFVVSSGRAGSEKV
jgi:alkaline phosphatase D